VSGISDSTRRVVYRASATGDQTLDTDPNKAAMSYSNEALLLSREDAIEEMPMHLDSEALFQTKNVQIIHECT
jgi:hypothetical protein